MDTTPDRETGFMENSTFIESESSDETPAEEIPDCEWCAQPQCEEGAPYQLGERVLCGRQDKSVLGGLPAFQKERSIVMSVWKQGTSRRSYMVHLQFDDGHCQTTKSRFIQKMDE